SGVPRAVSYPRFQVAPQPARYASDVASRGELSEMLLNPRAGNTKELGSSLEADQLIRIRHGRRIRRNDYEPRPQNFCDKKCAGKEPPGIVEGYEFCEGRVGNDIFERHHS